jgi:hypothetical protein
MKKSNSLIIKLKIFYFIIIISTIELCTAIETYPEYVCTLFPNDVPCACPLAASVYYNPSAYVTFTSEWLAIDGGVNVRFAGIVLLNN